jgi:hypothetical protein
MPGHPPRPINHDARAAAILLARRWLADYPDARTADYPTLCGRAAIVIEYLLVDVGGEDIGALVARVNAKYDNPPEPAV